jgi:hypothetical protein
MMMDNNRELQPQPTSTAIYPPAYPTAQPTYVPEPPIKASRWLWFRRTLRLLLVRLIRGLMAVGRVLRPYAAFVVAIIALLGVIGWMSYMLWGPAETAPAFQRADSLPPAIAIENYIKGQQSYNADIMWDAYSPDYQAAQLANGASKATLQAQANRERSMGLKYVRYDYIGGVTSDDGSLYFYSVDLALQTQHGRFPMVFRADKDGKITKIDLLIGQSNGSGQ